MLVLRSLILGFIFLFRLRPTTPRNIVCYYMGSSGIKLFPPENMDPKLCTHIIYAFVNLQINGTLAIGNRGVDINSRMYERVVNLKRKNPQLKVLLSIGPTAPSIYSNVAKSPECRKNFVASCEDFMQTYSFDGIDVDWEKPTLNDTENFVQLMKELQEKFAENSWILSAAVMPIPSIGYDIPELSKYVDMFNLMTYNFYGPWSAYTGQNSPLYESSIESSYEKKYLNLAVSVKNWINKGVPKEKINAGMAFYGRAYTLADAKIHGLHAPFIGKGKISPTPTYRQICTEFTEYTRVWDDEQKNPYKYKDNQWLSYDDEESIREKAKFIVTEGLGGGMIWQIAGDDISGQCGNKQGLLHVINEELNTF